MNRLLKLLNAIVWLIALVLLRLLLVAWWSV